MIGDYCFQIIINLIKQAETLSLLRQNDGRIIYDKLCMNDMSIIPVDGHAPPLAADRAMSKDVVSIILLTAHDMWSFLHWLLGGVREFTEAELAAATNSFAELVGKGAFGSVYKGFLLLGSPSDHSTRTKRILGNERISLSHPSPRTPTPLRAKLKLKKTGRRLVNKQLNILFKK